MMISVNIYIQIWEKQKIQIRLSVASRHFRTCKTTHTKLQQYILWQL